MEGCMKQSFRCPQQLETTTSMIATRMNLIMLEIGNDESMALIFMSMSMVGRWGGDG